MPEFQLQQQRYNRCQQPRPSSKCRALALKRALQAPKSLQKWVTAAKWAGNWGLITIQSKCNYMIYALSSTPLSPSDNHKVKSPSKEAKRGQDLPTLPDKSWTHSWKPELQPSASIESDHSKWSPARTHTNLQGLLEKQNQLSSYHCPNAPENKNGVLVIFRIKRGRGEPLEAIIRLRKRALHQIRYDRI